MFAIVLFAALVAIGVFLVLARFSTSPAVRAAEIEASARRPDPRARISPDVFRRLVIDLLGAMHIDVVGESSVRDDDAGRFRLDAVRHDALRDMPFVVFADASPRGDLIEQSTVVELADAVRGEPGSVGLLVTPYHIQREGLAGLGAAVELVDGKRLRALVEELIPDHVQLLDLHQGFGRVITPHEDRERFGWT
jgi:hypothetical protein